MAKPRVGIVSPSTITIEFRYHAPEAGEVWLVWGINGWQQAPEALRPPGTIVPDKVMQTLMVRTNNTFVITIQVPSGTVIDYGFLTSKTEKGTPVKLWEGAPSLPRAKVDSLIEFESTTSQVTPEQRQAWLSGLETDLPLVTQEIHYHLDGAGEVSLVWGANGWHNVPEAFRPSGTTVKDQLMHTLLVRKGNSFVTTIRVPPGMPIEYRFLVTKMEGGVPVNVWEDAADRSGSIVTTDGRIEMESKTPPVAIAQRKAWLAGRAADLPLVTQEIRYRAPRAAEVWLVWGLDGWQAIPDAAILPGTERANRTMKTFMAREGDIFTATVQVPLGSVINHRYLIAKPIEATIDGQREESRPGVFIAQFDGRIEFESRLTKVNLERRKAWPSGRLADLSLVTQEIRYRIAGVEEVWLVWGMNGWQAIPEAARPPGTVLQDNKVMHSRMVRKGDTFATTLRLPPGTKLDYKFLITKTSRGAPVTMWQDSQGQDFWKLVRVSGSLEEKATVTVVTLDQRKAWLAGQTTDLPLVAQEIRYRAPGAAEVWLVWGLDGWQVIPDAARPSDTVLKDNKVMHSRMVRKGDTFTTTVRVPPGAVLDFSFLIARTEKCEIIDIRQEKEANGRALSRVVAFDGRIEVQSNAWLTSPTPDPSLVAQEIRYRIAGTDEVWLVWGMNGWQAIPEAARPAGTVLKDNRLMHTRMVRKGDTFATTVRVPSGTWVDYRFLISKTSRGAPVTIWQDYNGKGFLKFVRVSGSLEEKATVTVVTLDQRKAWLAGEASDLPLVTQEIRYHAPRAAEVWLVWGLDGWQIIPDAARPPGTVLKSGKMHTPMVREGNMFITTVRVPPGTVLDFLALVTKTGEGTTVDIRHEKDEEGRALSRVVAFDGRIELQSQWKSRP
ncbi:MAG: hypothetical protein SGJ26_03455 [Nitrospirota bacterium]|nr:hypothetical protein [Nitrospirota bacterium]